jgi:hypothetical protein
VLTVGPFRIEQHPHWLVRRNDTRPLTDLRGIVIHTTGAQARDRGFDEMLERQATGKLGRNGWHYLIGADGRIAECIGPDRIANHAATHDIPAYRKADWWKTPSVQNKQAHPNHAFWLDRHPGFKSPLDKYPSLVYNSGSINRHTIGIELLFGPEDLTPAAIVALEFLTKVVHPGFIVACHSSVQPLRRPGYDLSPSQFEQVKHLL